MSKIRRYCRWTADSRLALRRPDLAMMTFGTIVRVRISGSWVEGYLFGSFRGLLLVIALLFERLFFLLILGLALDSLPGDLLPKNWFVL